MATTKKAKITLKEVELSICALNKIEILLRNFTKSQYNIVLYLLREYALRNTDDKGAIQKLFESKVPPGPVEISRKDKTNAQACLAAILSTTQIEYKEIRFSNIDSGYMKSVCKYLDILSTYNLAGLIKFKILKNTDTKLNIQSHHDTVNKIRAYITEADPPNKRPLYDSHLRGIGDGLDLYEESNFNNYNV